MSSVKWTNEQLQAIQENGSNILVAAAAGSGKTAVLVERIIHKIIDEKIDIDKMLVVTFTNAAASEMRERILEAIYKNLEKDPQNVHLQKQITLLNKASICTIHSFCLDVIRNNFYEIDMPSNFRIADTAEIALLKQDTLDDLFEQKYEENNSEFIELLETYTNYRGDEALQELVLNVYDFIQSAPFPEKWLQKNLEIFKENINAEDFTQTIWGKILNKHIKEELEESILQLQNMMDTMAKYVELAKFTQSIAEDISVLQDILHTINSWDTTYEKLKDFNFGKWPIDKSVTNDLKEQAKELKNKVKKRIKEGICKIVCKNTSNIYDDFQKMFPILQNLSNLVLEFSQNFANNKKEKNCIDFNDIEHFALKILTGNDGAKTEVAKKYQSKFVEIAIDEYQDSNLVQEAILSSISNGNNIFMVGDVKQSIYKFRQARPELFLNKYESYKIKEEKKADENLKIQLFRNFRSRQSVLDFTNFVFEVIMTKELGDILYNETEYLNYGANYPDSEETENYSHKAEMLILDLKEDEPITAFKDEEDEAEEQERIEDDVLEAKLVANKIYNILQSDYMVYDKTVGYRQIQAKDIVILLRATSTLAPIYEKELSDLNLPVFSDSSASYLESVEIETILSVLKIIDNPLQDIPLVVVLRSIIGNFSDNDLIKIRLTDKNCNFYDALLKARLSSQGDLKQKIEHILEMLKTWKEKEKYMALDELIWQIYLDTGYYQYVGLLPNGGVRQANLKNLFEKAKEYETASYKGLFNFIHFIEKLKKQNGDFEQAKLIGENENVIRIMSIHKSKGLEFPVVFLCSTQKKFNLTDLNESILLHQDLGFGPTFIDSKKRIKDTTLAKEAIKLKMKQETLSEEERILYVALTRAKEKLFITGRSKDLQKELNSKNQNLELYKIKENNCIKLDYKLIQKGKSYLDWLLYAYLLGQKVNIKLKGKEIPLEEIVKLSIYPKKDLIKLLKNQAKEEKVNVIEEIEKALGSYSKEETESVQAHLKDVLEWQYPYLVDTKLPNKTSVTSIKQEKLKLEQIETKDYENDEKEVKQNISYDKIVPKFLQEKQTISNAQKGTLVHLCIQRLDEHQDYTEESIKQLILELVQKEIITEKEAEAIDVNLIYKYTKSDLFKDLKSAKEIHKEQPFYISLPAKEVVQEAKEANSEKSILVQGIIDLYYINEKDELILIDFKTDFVGIEANAKQKLYEKYKVQLELYKQALEQATGKKVAKAELYLLRDN